jgi:hypothetical protein
MTQELEQVAPAQAETDNTAAADAARDDDRDAITALESLSAKQLSRVCRRLPLRTFLAEVEKLDRGVFFRHFKGYRPQKIDAGHLEKVFRAEIFAKRNGLLAQLIIFNWDEAEWRLYNDLQKEVKKINEDVEAIENITDEQGDAIVAGLQAAYDLRDVQIAFVINGVRVSPEFLGSRFAAVA